MIRESVVFRQRRTASWRSALVLAATAFACTSDTSPLRVNGPPDEGVLEGHVRSDAGAPVSGARIRLRRDGTIDSTAVITDSAGAFSATVSAGPYRLALDAPRGYVATADTASVRVPPAGRADVSLRANPVTMGERTIAPGRIDSLALATGLQVQVDARQAGVPVTVRLEQAAQQSGDADLVVPSAVFRLSIAGPSVGGTRLQSATGDAGSISLHLSQLLPVRLSSSADIVLVAGTTADPLYFWASASRTTYRDPLTGETHVVLETDTKIRADASEMTIAVPKMDLKCDGTDARKFYPLDNQARDGRTPLVLVHGWQFWPPWRFLSCSGFQGFHPETDVWSSLIAAVQGDPELNSRYKIYILRYPTFEPVLSTSEFLYNVLGDTMKNAVVIGHSMGGLVGRGVFAAHGSSSLAALITLATPHLGTPVADPTPTLWNLLPTTPSLCKTLPTGLAAVSHDVADNLSPSGTLQKQLAGGPHPTERIFALAGRTTNLLVGGCALIANGTPDNDEVVPVGSAVPAWATLQNVFNSHDHSDMRSASDVLTRVKSILHSLGSTCTAGPLPIGTSDFPVSGSVVRQPNGTVDITINPVVMDGKPISLTSDDFTVVENGCVKDFQVTTSLGNVGLDVVFAQDLSSSMNGAISGVRSSVLQFATDLYNRGLNVRIGSVGFSGAGTIPSTPAGRSSCEYLGPVQNLTDPPTFYNHVTRSWTSTAGCDDAENDLEAIEYAHRNMTWRAGAARAYIDVTNSSVHTALDNCNGEGPCTDETLSSIDALVGATSVIHVVAPADTYDRTWGGGMDPWALATVTGGKNIVLPNDGVVNLNALGIGDVLAQTTRLSFNSMTPVLSYNTLRVIVRVDGKIAEFTTGLAPYSRPDPSLRRAESPVE